MNRFCLFLALLSIPNVYGQLALTPAQIAKRVSPSVVMIQGQSDSSDIVGSGFIVSRNGDVVTNLHVVRDMKVANVHLSDGRVFRSVEVMGVNEAADLAIIRISGSFPVLVMGDERTLSVGDPVVAVGSPLGLDGTVTTGIISAIREAEGNKYLQTDAAVNPGNSGGPLVDATGKAIGIICFKMRSAESLNFAIPISVAHRLLADAQRRTPISLDQMRSLLTPPSTQQAIAQPKHDQTESGPSLKETLNWLQKELPNASEDYRGSLMPGGPYHSSTTLEPTRFDSCTVEYDYRSVTIYTLDASFNFDLDLHETIPLSSVTSVRVLPTVNVLTGSYGVVIRTERDAIASLNYNLRDDKPLLTRAAYFGFRDLSTAEMFAKTLHHAVDLCRGSNANAF